MNTAVLQSMRPEWCEKICSGIKTIEVRKSRPTIDTPFRVPIYCTHGRDMLWILEEKFRTGTTNPAAIFTAKAVGGANLGNGKVIGEYVCDNITRVTKTGCTGSGEKPTYKLGPNLACACLTYDQLEEYAKGRPVYLWHISELKVYDKPKELSEYFRICDGMYDRGKCWECEKAVGEEMDCGCNYELHLTRPPQSWCYVRDWRK